MHLHTFVVVRVRAPPHLPFMVNYSSVFRSYHKTPEVAAEHCTPCEMWKQLGLNKDRNYSGPGCESDAMDISYYFNPDAHHDRLRISRGGRGHGTSSLVHSTRKSANWKTIFCW
jgi:hypothetical protein